MIINDHDPGEKKMVCLSIESTAVWYRQFINGNGDMSQFEQSCTSMICVSNWNFQISMCIQSLDFKLYLSLHVMNGQELFQPYISWHFTYFKYILIFKFSFFNTRTLLCTALFLTLIYDTGGSDFWLLACWKFKVLLKVAIIRIFPKTKHTLLFISKDGQGLKTNMQE